MQFRNFFAYLLLTTFILLAGSAEAQKITTNELGEKIIVYPDGSWRYFDEELNEENVSTDLEEEVSEKKKKKKKKKKRVKGKKVKAKKKKSKKGKSKKIVYTAEEEAQAQREALQRAEWAAQQEEKARQQEEDAIFARIFLEEELEDAFNSVEVSPDKIDDIETRLEKAQALEKIAKAKRKEASKIAQEAEKMIDMKKEKRDKLLVKMKASEEKESADLMDAITESEGYSGDQDFGTTNEDDQGWFEGKESKDLAKYDEKKDVMVNPPQMNCEFAFDDIDEFTGKRRVELAKATFFTHTSDRLKPYFKNNHHITGEGFLSASTGGVKYFNLTISILSEHAQREFGVLEKGSILTIKLINGATVKLLNTKTATGSLNKVTKTTVYRGQYLLSGDHQKSLKKSEVDKVRVVWGTGYEDYEVYELDFFIDQLDCLDKK